MGRSLLKDVDLDTLYAMRRDEKLNNQEIADRLGVSRVTVYKLIGPQPKELRKEYERSPRKPVEAQKAEEATPLPACLVVGKRTIELSGTFGKYSIEVGEDCFQVTNLCGESMAVPKARLDDFINELNAIKRKLEVLKFENEMW